MEAYIGTIIAFAGNFIPQGWLECNGQKLDVANYGPLHQVIKNTYGGDGTTTFNLPDLQGNVIMGAGVKGGFDWEMGKAYGSAAISLDVKHLPAHNHNIMVSEDFNNTNTPGDAVMFGKWKGGVTIIDESGIATGTNVEGNSFTSNVLASKKCLSPNSISSTGQGQSFNIVQPSLVCRYIICVAGAFPPEGRRRILINGNEHEHINYKVFQQWYTVGKSSEKKKIFRVNNPFDKSKYGFFPVVQIQNTLNYTDAFTTTLIATRFDTEYFDVVICRIDGDSWAQDLIMSVSFNYFEIAK